MANPDETPGNPPRPQPASTHQDHPDPPPAPRTQRVGGSGLSPVEHGGPELARSLDDYLSYDRGWSSRPGHLSQSVRLIEATYLALLARLDPVVAAPLRDSWATTRHAELVRAVVAQRGWLAALTIEDRLDLLRRESDARRAVRRDWAGLADEAYTEALRAISDHLPTHAAGTATLMLGSLGSGKSEVCEEWFRAAVDRLEADWRSPRPVWLHARELATASLETVLAGKITWDEVASNGVALVIDGLDEVEALSAHHILDQAKVLVRVHSSSCVVLASRPGVLSDAGNEYKWDGLDRDDAVKIVGTVAGSESATEGWSSSLVDSVRRPFFAIAAGLYVAAGRSPRSEAELIDYLVRRALSRASAASSSIQSADELELLTRLAVDLTRYSGSNHRLDFIDQARVLRSTLVSSRPDHRLEFSLPIFQQWFAARALLSSTELILEALASPPAFDRWRWTLAVAGIIATPDQLDDLLELAIRTNLGAGAWMLDRIAEGHRSFRETNGALLQPSEAPRRLLRSLRCWIDSLQELASCFYPVQGSEPITLGVRVSGNRVDMGWKRTHGAEDAVIDLPAEVHPLAPPLDDWWADRAGVVPEGDEWPWLLGRDRAQGEMLKTLNTEPFLGPREGVWVKESRYRSLRRLMGASSALFPAISRDLALSKAAQLLSHIDDPQHAVFVMGGRRFRGEVLVDLVTWMEQLDSDWIYRPAPTPDLTPSEARSGWVWDLYSEAGLQRFYAEVYELAAVAYDELAGSTFAPFAWSLGTLADGPYGVIADLSYGSGRGSDHMPILNWAKVPEELVSEAREKHGDAGISSSLGRAYVTLSTSGAGPERWIADFLRDRLVSARLSRSNPFSRLGAYGQHLPDETQRNRPASLLASKWMFTDLKSVGMARGTFPQLDD